jgi:hypothetical protein
MCDFEISKRPPPPPPPVRSSKRSFPKGVRLEKSPSVKDLEKALSIRLEEFGKQLMSEFDLTTETARKLSLGFKFHPHMLLSKGTKAKTGGAQLAGRVLFDKYISYRMKEDVFAFLCILEANKQPEDVEFHIICPPEYIENWMPLQEMRSYLEEGEVIGKTSGGSVFSSFDEAASYFRAILEKVAPKHNR